MKKSNIVGIGAVSGYGFGVAALETGLKSGESAVAPQPCTDGSLPDNSWYARIPVDETEDAKLTRFSVCYEAAIDEAIADARARGWAPGRKIAIVHGSARGDINGTKTLMDNPKTHIRHAYIACLPSTPMAIAAAKYGFTGPIFTVNGTCATGLFALSVAQRLLACDDATDVIVCGTDIGSALGIFNGLEQLGVLFTDRPAMDATKPLNAASKGFVFGEGSAALVLTNDHDDSRYLKVGSSVLANDGYHPISIEPSHREITAAMSDALQRASLPPEAIQTYVAHGTGTAQCNNSDLHVLNHLPAVGRILAPKPYLGHCRAAASLLETVIMASNSTGALGQGDLDRIKPDVPLKAAASDQSFPCLHMSLGAGGNIAMAVYER